MFPIIWILKKNELLKVILLQIQISIITFPKAVICTKVEIMCEEFLLKWNDYQSSFSQMMSSLCLSQEMVDCSISAGSKTFSVHRMVLSTCSAYFRSLFAGVAPHQHPVIVISETCDELVELLVRYMYSGQVSVTQDQLVPLVQAAKSLGIKGLIDVPVPENQEQEKTPGKPGPPPLCQKKQALKVKSHSNLSSVLTPISKIGEVDVYPSHEENEDMNGLDSTSSGIEEWMDEGVDPIGSDVDQSVRPQI